MKKILVSVLFFILSGSVHALSAVVRFQVYSSPNATDTYHVYKRSESACMYDMDEAHFDVSQVLSDVVFYYDARIFYHCGWHASWQWFVVQRNHDVPVFLEWYNGRNSFFVNVLQDSGHLICNILPQHGKCPPRVIIGDGIHCPPAGYSGASCSTGSHG